jgi:type VI secretion system protein VasJ
MQSLPQSHGERHMAFRQALMAQLAESKGRVDIALHLISGLDDRLSLPAIKSWEPGFVFDVKATYLRLLRQRNSRKDADRSQSLALIQRLMAELTQLDPVRALLLPTE